MTTRAILPIAITISVGGTSGFLTVEVWVKVLTNGKRGRQVAVLRWDLFGDVDVAGAEVEGFCCDSEGIRRVLNHLLDRLKGSVEALGDELLLLSQLFLLAGCEFTFNVVSSWCVIRHRRRCPLLLLRGDLLQGPHHGR